MLTQKMTKGQRGMRKGISLVEMLLAVVVFGLISAAGYKYYKNYYNTTLASKQTLTNIVIEQATQISNAYDMYEAKFGTVPTTVDNLSDANVKLLTETPDAIPEISATGWSISTAYDFNADGTNDVAFVYPIDSAALGTAIKKAVYCNVLNNIADAGWDLNASVDSTDNVVTSEQITTAADMYAKTTWNFSRFMCATPDDSVFNIIFVKTLN